VTKISCKEDIDECSELKELFFMEMMEDGFWLTKRGSVALIIGTPQRELDRFVVCVERFLERHQSLVSLAH
jgi:glutamate-1-semialdehyde 2,1-aminomutase